MTNVFFAWLDRIDDMRQLRRDANELVEKHSGRMSRIAAEFSNSKRVVSVTRVRSGYIIKTANRGVVELRGTDDFVEEFILNPQLTNQ